MYNIPILFITFNRLDTTKRVFDAIKAVKPARLYLFSDGPRQAVEGEKEKIQEVRDWLQGQLDWPCETDVRFLSENMGPRHAISHAVNWMFETEEHGIIFEHDCLPGTSFFPFCKEMLGRYRDDERVMCISGNNFSTGNVSIEASYTFSRHSHIWGFATWKRAWAHYNVHMPGFEKFVETGHFDLIVLDKHYRDRYIKILEKVERGEVGTWDYQWFYNMWANSGLIIVPRNNLVSNVGFGEFSLNSKNPDVELADIPVKELSEEWKHPEFICPDLKLENDYLRVVFPSLIRRLKLVRKLNRTLKKL